MRTLPITVAIPTYRRERVLLDTIDSLLRLDGRAAEVLILDQTDRHSPETNSALENWSKTGQIRWIRLAEPSIPKSMNVGLLEARNDVVLFVDDDIVPYPALLQAHVGAHRESAALIAGRVLQPWDHDAPSASWAEHQFAATESRNVDRFIGCNFSVNRHHALALGGFDENFVRVAYNFEREFADRWRASGGTIQFLPRAAIRHLKVRAGGTRTYGEHLTTLFPAHSVGAYYYLLRSKVAEHRVREFMQRPVRSVMTRHHLHRPWWIPVTFVAEIMGIAWAFMLYLRGPRYCTSRLARSV